MNSKKANRLKAVLFILFFYILAQLAWWAFLISKLTAEVYTNDIRLDHKIAMVWGEGIVFASILLAGFIFTYRSYSKELALAKQQRNFLMSVTHEFKTPIASLSLSLQTLQSRKLSEEKFQELLLHALNDTSRLNTLAENMLLATRIDQNVFPMKKVSTDLSSLIKNSVSTLNGVDAQPRLLLDIEENIVINCDPFMIQSVIVNLVDNALKYSSASTKVELKLRKINHAVEIKVIDQGVGISAGDVQKIFQKFVRLGNEETRIAKGTGLGLYIVDYFIQQHLGSINVVPNKPNGTQFIVQLPE